MTTDVLRVRSALLLHARLQYIFTRAIPFRYKGMAAAPDIARNINRSIVGIHAADILRVSRWVTTTFGAPPLATVATGMLSPAALHASLLGSSLHHRHAADAATVCFQIIRNLETMHA